MTTDHQPGQAWLPPGGMAGQPAHRPAPHRSLGEALPFGGGGPGPPPEPELPPHHPAAPSDGTPGIGPVIAFTFFFGFFAAISAARRTSRAQTAGVTTGKYWAAFAWTLAGSWVLGLVLSVGAVLLIALLAPPATTTADGISADWLEGSIVEQARTQGADGQVLAPEAADCAGSQVGADGAGIYHCTIHYPGSYRSVVAVTVSSNGEWVAA